MRVRVFYSCLVFLLPLCFVASYGQTTPQFITPHRIAPTGSGTQLQLFGVADFNGDGRPDILSGSYVLLQNSNGTFTAKSTGITINEASGSTQIPVQVIVIADLNGDGKPDLVMAAPGGEVCSDEPDADPPCEDFNNGVPIYAYLQVALGKGDGTFSFGPTFNLTQGINLPTIIVKDVNGDGTPDIVVASDDNPPDTGSYYGAIQTFFNDGRGNFTAGPSTPQCCGKILAAADFNGDGKLDLLVSNPYSYGNSEANWKIVAGAGDGSFNINSPIFSSTGDVDTATVGDFNHDGTTDAVVLPAYGQAVVYLNPGNGDLTQSQTLQSRILGLLSAPYLFPIVKAADFNHDGSLDLVVFYPGYAAIFRNNGKGVFSDPRIYNLGTYDFSADTVADMNSDGNLDLITNVGLAFDGGNFDITFGSRYGSFSAPIITSDLMGVYKSELYPIPNETVIASADFNNDGIPDIARLNITDCTSCKSSVSIFSGSGKGYLNAGTSYPVDVVYGTTVVGDVNGDGKPDIVITRVPRPYDGLPLGTDDISVLLGKGDGTVQPAISRHVLGAPAAGTTNTQTWLADVNHDGKLDLIGDWGVALGNGDGTFQAPIRLPSSISHITSMAVADLNHDGNPDLVVAQSAAGVTTTIYTLLGSGTASYKISSQETVQNNPLVPNLILADFNGDGYDDLAYIDFNNGVMVQPGRGDGTFNAGTLAAVPVFAYYYASPNLIAADFNRDGNTDLLILNGTSTKGEIALLLGTGKGTFTAPQYYDGPMTSGIAVDLNGDGAPDVAGNTAAGISRMLNTGSK